jgi:hypothetical protein
MTLPTVQHPEYPVTSDTYLNLYAGVDYEVELEKFSHYIGMNEEQKSKFETFWEQVEDDDVVVVDEDNNDNIETSTRTTNWTAIRPDKFTCLRFLQADKYDTKLAMKRLKQNQEWLLSSTTETTTTATSSKTKTTQDAKTPKRTIPDILQNPPTLKLQVYRKLRARAYMGRTNGDEMPIFAERLGDFMNAIPSPEGKTLTKEDFRECFLYDLGEVLGQIRDNYKLTKDDPDTLTTWKANWIMDANNMRLFRATSATSTIQYLDSITEPNFPEIAGAPITIMNVPSLVAGVWRLIKAFLDPVTAAKVQITSTVPTQALLQRIPSQVLLEEYGGSNKVTEFAKAEYS